MEQDKLEASIVFYFLNGKPTKKRRRVFYDPATTMAEWLHNERHKHDRI